MKCPTCDQKQKQYKNGKTKAGSQRYRCHSCGYSYTPEKKVQGYSRTIRQKAIRMYIDGSGLRRTGRQLGVHHQTVANWAKEHAEQLPNASVPVEVKTAEFDELFTYMGDKKTESISLRFPVHFGLESRLGTFAAHCASHCRSCAESQMVFQ